MKTTALYPQQAQHNEDNSTIIKGKAQGRQEKNNEGNSNIFKTGKTS